MTTQIRSLSQIPVRTKYLITVRPCDATLDTFLGSCAVTLPSGQNPGSLIDVATAELLTFVQYTPTEAGILFKDLGRQITIVDTLGEGANTVAVFRQVQLMNGAGSEGVANNATYSANIYLKVFAADGLHVIVARTG